MQAIFPTKINVLKLALINANGNYHLITKHRTQNNSHPFTFDYVNNPNSNHNTRILPEHNLRKSCSLNLNNSLIPLNYMCITRV